MKIYFAGSIRGGRDDRDIYFSIIKELQKYGTVLTEHIGDPNLKDTGEEISESEIYARDMTWLKASDIVVAEVTTVSMGVGYELGQAEAMGKKVICLHRDIFGKRLSAMISGNPYFMMFKYESVPELVEYFEKNLR